MSDYFDLITSEKLMLGWTIFKLKYVKAVQAGSLVVMAVEYKSKGAWD